MWDTTVVQLPDYEMLRGENLADRLTMVPAPQRRMVARYGPSLHLFKES
jgi:hypothetical protein